jgi:hypothetical protein
MPRKQHTLTDEERAKRIRETARELGTDNDPKALERAFNKVVRATGAIPSAAPLKSRKTPARGR